MKKVLFILLTLLPKEVYAKRKMVSEKMREKTKRIDNSSKKIIASFLRTIKCEKKIEIPPASIGRLLSNTKNRDDFIQDLVKDTNLTELDRQKIRNYYCLYSQCLEKIQLSRKEFIRQNSSLLSSYDIEEEEAAVIIQNIMNITLSEIINSFAYVYKKYFAIGFQLGFLMEKSKQLTLWNIRKKIFLMLITYLQQEIDKTESKDRAFNQNILDKIKDIVAELFSKKNLKQILYIPSVRSHIMANFLIKNLIITCKQQNVSATVHPCFSEIEKCCDLLDNICFAYITNLVEEKYAEENLSIDGVDYKLSFFNSTFLDFIGCLSIYYCYGTLLQECIIEELFKETAPYILLHIIILRLNVNADVEKEISNRILRKCINFSELFKKK